MDYQRFYDFVVQEEQRLWQQDIAGDYRLCKALAACYELQIISRTKSRRWSSKEKSTIFRLHSTDDAEVTRKNSIY